MIGEKFVYSIYLTLELILEFEVKQNLRKKKKSYAYFPETAMNNRPNPFPRIVIQEQAPPKQEQGTAQARRIPFTGQISYGKESLILFTKTAI